MSEAIARMYSAKNVFLKISLNAQKNTCSRVIFCYEVARLGHATLLKKRLAQLLSCECCEISKNTFFQATLPMAASVMRM